MRLTIAAALATAGAGLLLGIILSDARVARAKAELADTRAAHALALADLRAQALQAEQDAAEREQTMWGQINAIETQAHAQLQAAQKDAQAARLALADTDRALDRLRSQAAAGGGRSCADPSNPNPTPASLGPSQPDRSAVSVLADLLAQRSAELVTASRYADELAAVAAACEGSYDAARAAATSAL